MLPWMDFNFSRAVFLLVSCCAFTCVHCTNVARSLHVIAGTPEAGNDLISMSMNFKLLGVFLWCICCNWCLQGLKADEGHGKRGFLWGALAFHRSFRRWVLCGDSAVTLAERQRLVPAADSHLFSGWAASSTRAGWKVAQQKLKNYPLSAE